MSSDLLAELVALLGDRCSTAPSHLDLHGRDESPFDPCRPDAVVWPGSTEEVQAVVRVCGRYGVPIVAFGAGTSVEGHVLPTAGGVSLDLTQMDAIVAIRPHDLDVTVQAGVTRLRLAEKLADHGLFFPVDPGADATLGGMAATGASGTNAVRYGTMKENVLGLEVVLADGTVVRTGSRARKSSSGYDLTRLFVGSEGTLGIITELHLKVYGIPESTSAAVCSFPDLSRAVAAAAEVVQWGIPVARMELLDGVMMDAIRRYTGLDHPASPTLFFEFHGSPAGVEEQARATEGIVAEHGAAGFRWATRPEDRARLWEARHHALFAALALRPGCRAISTDVCVPVSELAGCVAAAQEDVAAASFPVPLVGHVGDGNFHLILVVDPGSPDELEAASRLNEALVRHALAAGGTATGEHGVGIGKRRFMAAEHGAGLDVMRTIKSALDPRGILNPGKVLPEG